MRIQTELGSFQEPCRLISLCILGVEIPAKLLAPSDFLLPQCADSLLSRFTTGKMELLEASLP